MKKLIISIGLIAVLAVVWVELIQNDNVALGSVSVAESYMATTTSPAATYSTGISAAGEYLLKKTPGQFGSVVLLGANTGIFELYDATTSNANLRTKTATTTLATVPASMAAGTYIFDVGFNYGLLLVVRGAPATSTITFK